MSLRRGVGSRECEVHGENGTLTLFELVSLGEPWLGREREQAAHLGAHSENLISSARHALTP